MIIVSDFDLDGSPDNISFMIKRIKVHTEESLKDPSYKFYGNYGVEKFLELFSGTGRFTTVRCQKDGTLFIMVSLFFQIKFRINFYSFFFKFRNLFQENIQQ